MAWDPVWEEVFKKHAWGKYPAEELIRFVARNFYKSPDRKQVNLLEVGCGPGANLWYMAREGFTVYGIDGSETAVAQARERLERECPGWTGELLVGDIAALPFPDGFFDAVIDIEAVTCNPFENSQAIYQEMARVTKQGGKLFSRTFAKGCWGEGTGTNVGHNAWIVAEGPLTGIGYNRFTAFEEIAELVRGFSIIETELFTRTMDNRRHEVKEWIIMGEKK